MQSINESNGETGSEEHQDSFEPENNNEASVPGYDHHPVNYHGNLDRDSLLKAEEYLQSEEVRFCKDPRLKKEIKKLEDLLASYKKLIGKLGRNFNSEEERKAEEERIHKVPEIYAVLHPELYQNPREEEKLRLIQKFSKRQFSPADRVIPPTCRTPVILLNDKRQEEKERFIKLIASCPARLVNSVDCPITPLKSRKPRAIASTFPVKNSREVEKERLSKILANSGIYYRKTLDKRSKDSFCKLKQDKTQSSNYQETFRKENMVHAGDNSSLSLKDQNSNHLRANGVTRLHMNTNRRKEARVQLEPTPVNGVKKVDKTLSTNELDGPADGADSSSSEDSEEIHRRKRCSSASTQTDPADIAEEIFQERNVINETLNRSRANSIKKQPLSDSSGVVPYLSPREKLLSDLHGDTHCFPGGIPMNSPSKEIRALRKRQEAYAQALKEQIEEKRRLEEERKRKEKEEDMLMDRKVRLQQEKLQSEVNEEQRKKLDWIAQRQSHEEVLRRRMLELQLEAQELKRAERRKHQGTDHITAPTREEAVSRPLPPSQTIHPGPQRPAVSVGPSTSSERRFDGVRMAPLLEADRQNVLSMHGPDYNLSGSRSGVSDDNPISNTIAFYKTRERQKAADLIKAPTEFRIERPPSPPIPAVKTKEIINNNKLLDNKWEVPKDGHELQRTQIGTGGDNVLSRLGAFRRQVHQEHMKLEARLQKQQQSP